MTDRRLQLEAAKYDITQLAAHHTRKLGPKETGALLFGAGLALMKSHFSPAEVALFLRDHLVEAEISESVSAMAMQDH